MSASASPPADPPAAMRGKEIARLLSEQKFAEVLARFDSTMSAALPEAKLAETWAGLIKAFGPLQSIGSARVEQAGAYQSVVVTCRFEKSDLDLKLAFDASDRVAGFFVAPTPAPWTAPAYADASKLDEREIVVNPGPWQLPGTLTLPKAQGRHPAIVLVHGSGPGDRDGTIGPNRPFKDLALGLASRGIAVLRFEKRTLQHRGKLTDVSSFGLDDESVDDAIAAVELLKSEPTIDPARVFVAGLSLGGTFAPRIGARAKGVAGIVILAGATRSLDEAMEEQLTYIASLDGKTGPEEKAQIEAVKKAGVRMRELQRGAPPRDGEVVLGAGAKYWIELGRYDALKTAKELRIPIYVAQGGRDYQVTEVDFRNWQRSLAGRSDVTLKLYPDLNHLMMKGTGKSTPEEYQHLGHVDEELIADLAAWLSRQR